MATRAQLRNYGRVPLPPMISCNECKILKKQDQYSANRLADLQKQIIMAGKNKQHFDPKSTGFIRCSLCLGGVPQMELQCHHCDIIYPITYFSKQQRKGSNRDKALCWSCLERQTNEDLSSSEEESDDDSDGSEGTFVTTPYQDLDNGSVLSGGSSTSRGYDNSSGGVPLNGNTAPGTIYAGSSSKASTIGPAVSQLSALSLGSSSNAGTSASVTSSHTAGSGGSGFNVNKYGNPGHRSKPPTDSVASGITSRSRFPKIPAAPTKVDMDVVREQEGHMRRAVAPKQSASKKAAAADAEIVVSDDEENPD